MPPLPRTVHASLDFWDDNIDVYRVYLKAGSKLFARLTPAARGTIRMALWAPGTQRVDGIAVDTGARLAQSHRVGAQSRIAFSVRETGTYYLEAKLVSRPRDPAPYALSLVRR